MLNKRFLVVPLVLFADGISYAIDKFDIQVCEAQVAEASKIRCYSDLQLNPSCQGLDTASQLSCYRKSAESMLPSQAESSSQEEEESLDPRNDFFGQPQRLCSALTAEGIITSAWKAANFAPGEWLCWSSLTPVGSVGGNGMQNNIQFFVFGTSQARANDIRINININNPAERERAFARLEAATKSLFNAISTPIPPDLARALARQQPTSVSTGFGRAELILEPGGIDSFKVVLTDARFLAIKENERANSADDFDACKRVTATAAGYSASHISGDGAPIQEAGYMSFMLKGRGKDLFFCEVHPGGRYKVNAALNGMFPFKYIAEGSF